ncbi:MAG TPA: hypothetical protein VHD55_00520 [Candidatus Paceibacterota bacterium]|nr:hypothetical protein [Candidatus Paceibacterota bacterium]
MLATALLAPLAFLASFQASIWASVGNTGTAAAKFFTTQLLTGLLVAGMLATAVLVLTSKGGRRVFAVFLTILLGFFAIPMLASLMSGSGAPEQVAVGSVGPQDSCSSKTSYALDTETPTNFNPGGMCAPDLWHDGHCIIVQRAAWTGDTTPYEVCGGSLPNDAEWAWSADTPFILGVALSPPRYN